MLVIDQLSKFLGGFEYFRILAMVLFGAHFVPSCLEMMQNFPYCHEACIVFE